MGELFGTDGIRGLANKELTGDMAYKIGRAGGYYLTRNYNQDQKPVMLIGKDTRISGDMLESALTAGLTSAGIDVVELGIIPTPGVAYLTQTMDVKGSIMISASHNPIQDNGIKFFNVDGYKLTDEMEDDIEHLIFDDYDQIPNPTHEEIGKAKVDYNLVERYIDHLVESVSGDFSDLKVVVDCANGAAYYVAPQVLKSLGVELNVINNEANGEKINVNSGSTDPDVVKDKVVETGADLGIAHDGDADRLVMVDEKGEIVDGDKIMAILALDLKRRDQLQGETLVTTPYSNLGLKEALSKEGIEIVFTKNGDRYVLQEMLNNNYNFGGEKSGHIIYLDYNHTGDGVLSAIQVLQVIKNTGKSLSELAGVMSEWPQILSNVEVKYKNKWEQNSKIKQVIKKAEKEFGDEGRVFVRASGTEPVIRIMLEGKDKKLLQYWDEKISEIISSELN